jgi:hypothetical protein
MNKIFFLCLTSAVCFSQEMEKPKFSITQIDSLSKNESCFKIFDYGNKIHVERIVSESKSKIIGEGYGGWKISAHFNDSINYKKLSREEIRKYDDKNTCLIIRADYSSLVNYDDGTIEKEAIYFYFNQDVIFYVKYLKDNFSMSFPYSTIESELAKNDTLKTYLQTKANEIKKVWNER